MPPNPPEPEKRPDERRPDDAPRTEGGEAEEDHRRSSRMFRMARRLMDRKELAEDTRELLVNVLATSDKAKTEAVRLLAREVRNYLDALELKEILTGYSLEVSIHLKPLAEAPSPDEKDEPES